MVVAFFGWERSESTVDWGSYRRRVGDLGEFVNYVDWSGTNTGLSSEILCNLVMGIAFNLLSIFDLSPTDNTFGAGR